MKYEYSTPVSKDFEVVPPSRQTVDETMMNLQVVSAFGFTRGDLLEAFNNVKNPRGWKLAIDSTVDIAEVHKTSEAIIFFTGSIPHFTQMPGRSVFRVEAAGYYVAMGEVE